MFLPLDGKQEEIINSDIPEKDLVPNTPSLTQISVTGQIQYDQIRVIASPGWKRSLHVQLFIMILYFFLCSLRKRAVKRTGGECY